MTTKEEILKLAGEPVAYLYSFHNCFGDVVWTTDFNWGGRTPIETKPLYTAEQVLAACRAERERCAVMLLNGSFLHDQAPAALFAKEAAAAIRKMED